MPSEAPVLPGTQMPTREDPAINPETVRRPREFCPDQKSRSGWEIA